MKMFKTKEEVIDTIINEQNILIVQDLDGVCIPLVQDPLKRELNKEYVKDVSRLRDKFNDDLFVRTGSGMVPTQKTENMISDIQNALTLIQQSVNEPDTFDPATSKRNFKLSLGDISESRVLPFIMKEIYECA